MIFDLLDGTAISHRRAILGSMVALAVAVTLISPLTTLEQWVGWFPTTINATETAIIWLPSVLCAYAAWVGGQARTHGLREWTMASPRNAAQRILPTLVLVGFSTLVAQFFALLVIMGVSIHFGLTTYLVGRTLLISIPTVISYLFVWLAIGASLGRSVGRLFALPLAAILPYSAYAIVSLYLSDTPLDALAINDGRVYDYIRPSTGMILVRATFWFSLAIALWAWTLHRRRLTRFMGWVTSVTAAVALFVGASFPLIPNADQAQCQGSLPKTCLDVAHATAMGRYRQAVGQVWNSIPPPMRPVIIGSAPTVIPRNEGRILIAGPVYGDTRPSRLVDQKLFTALLGDALFRDPCIANDIQNETSVSLVLWWRMQHGISLDRPAYAGDEVFSQLDPQYAKKYSAAVAFARQSPVKRDAWFSAHASQVFSCHEPALGVM